MHQRCGASVHPREALAQKSWGPRPSLCVVSHGLSLGPALMQHAICNVRIADSDMHSFAPLTRSVASVLSAIFVILRALQSARNLPAFRLHPPLGCNVLLGDIKVPKVAFCSPAPDR